MSTADLCRIEDLSLFPRSQGPDSPCALLRHIHFRIPEQGIFAVLGETGSGKTLLMKCLLGMKPAGYAWSGRLLYTRGSQCTDILSASKGELRRLRGRELMWIPQDGQAALNPLLNCERQILLPLRRVLHLTPAECRRRIAELFSALELEPRAELLRAYPFELSGGMKMRFMLAIALAMGTRTLVLDEPTKGLDSARIEGLMRLLHERAETDGLRIILVTHDLPLALREARHCAVLRGGECLVSGPVKDILGHPEHPYIQALWQALPENGMRIPAEEADHEN